MKTEPKFVPGERAVLHSKEFPQFSGLHIQIISVEWNDFHEVYEYDIQPDPYPDDRWWGEYSLRKLPPNTPSTFEDCIFKPEKVNV